MAKGYSFGKGGKALAELVLELSKKARDTFGKWNGEGHIEIANVGSG